MQRKRSWQQMPVSVSVPVSDKKSTATTAPVDTPVPAQPAWDALQSHHTSCSSIDAKTQNTDVVREPYGGLWVIRNLFCDNKAHWHLITLLVIFYSVNNIAVVLSSFILVEFVVLAITVPPLFYSSRRVHCTAVHCQFFKGLHLIIISIIRKCPFTLPLHWAVVFAYERMV